MTEPEERELRVDALKRRVPPPPPRPVVTPLPPAPTVEEPPAAPSPAATPVTAPEPPAAEPAARRTRKAPARRGGGAAELAAKITLDALVDDTAWTARSVEQLRKASSGVSAMNVRMVPEWQKELNDYCYEEGVTVVDVVGGLVFAFLTAKGRQPRLPGDAS